MKALRFTITCPRCGGEVTPVTSDDPKGWINRERRKVVSCNKRHCAWAGVVVVELVDLTHQRAVA
jgi:hypothetical protein